MSHAVKRSADKRAAAWQYLRAIGVDVALVQEAGLPVTDVADSIINDEVDGRDWTTAVVSYGPLLTHLDQPLTPSWGREVKFNIPDAARPGTLALAMVDVPGEKPILAISLYGMLRYADQSVIRAASDLLPIFDTPLKHRVIVAGDLNLHTHSNDPAERARAGPILGLLESFGLANLVTAAQSRGSLRQGPQAHLQPCPCKLPDCSHIRTHRHGRHVAGAMANNDYMFATKELVDRLESLTVMNGDDDPAWEHSDHAPLVASFRAGFQR